MAITETYVDPSIAADSGTGTIGDPYGDLQYALNTMTRDATNGDRLNIKAGTEEVLVAILSLATYGVPTQVAPLWFQGYTAVADDGGQGGINAGGSNPVYASSSQDSIAFVNLDLHNVSGGDSVVRVDRNCIFRECNFFAGSNAIMLQTGNYCRIENCYFIDGSGFAISGILGIEVINCTFRNGTTDFGTVIRVGASSVIKNNILIVDGATNGIEQNGDTVTIRNNSIYSVNGTGQAVLGNDRDATILSNIIEGFSGIGGVGIAITDRIAVYGYNKFFNNTSNEGTLDVVNDLGNNDTLGASPFIDAAGDDFRANASVKAGAYPTANFPDLSVRTFLDIGALQRQEGRRSRMRLHNA